MDRPETQEQFISVMNRPETQEQFVGRLSTRKYAWQAAAEMVEPIVDRFGLQPYRNTSGFVHQSTTTAVDQNIDQIIRVADWLLDRD